MFRNSGNSAIRKTRTKQSKADKLSGVPSLQSKGPPRHAMKLIQCIVHPAKLDQLITALQPVTSGMTVHEIRSCGPGISWHAIYRGVEYETLLPRILLDIVSDDTWVDDIIRIVVETARTGEANNGSIQIMPVEESYHVRTGFMDQ